MKHILIVMAIAITPSLGHAQDNDDLWKLPKAAFTEGQSSGEPIQGADSSYCHASFVALGQFADEHSLQLPTSLQYDTHADTLMDWMFYNDDHFPTMKAAFAAEQKAYSWIDDSLKSWYEGDEQAGKALFSMMGRCSNAPG